MRALLRVWWLPALAVLLISTAVLYAQDKPWVDGSINQLVAEVRALRQSVERTGSLTARTQALLGRVQLLDSRLADLRRRLDEARQRIRASASPAEVAQVRLEEQEVLAALATEQRRWSDYNARLEALERELARDAGRQP
jgi:predicted RNase H-like nuclease (RuvC/YqgF family)